MADVISRWERVFEKWGYPTFMLAIVIFVMWRFAQWAEPRANDLVNTHMAFIHTIEKSQIDLIVRQEEINKILRSIDQNLRELRELQK